MAIKEYRSAEQAFQRAYRIFRTRSGKSLLSVAKAMERMGVALSHHAASGEDPAVRQNRESPTDEHMWELLHRAYTVLLESLRIRRDELGPYHVDTVDTLNWIAKVLLQTNDQKHAKTCYWEVYWIRRSLFGENHPSCAVVAHDLANVFLQLQDLDDANNFYQIALHIYEHMRLPAGNPTVQRLLHDMKRLERVVRFRENQPHEC